jgi:CheY-like chemotaxis protein
MVQAFHYLYVEDDPLSREVMQTLLVEVVGVGSLTIFDDSADFSARLKVLTPIPNFIFLDINILPHDGYELLTMIRRQPAFGACKVLAVTSGVLRDEVARLQAHGFDGALAKPLDMQTFPGLIARLEAGETIWQTG